MKDEGLSKGDKVKILSPALGKPGTVAIVKRAHPAGYIIRFANGQTEFALPEELEKVS